MLELVVSSFFFGTILEYKHKHLKNKFHKMEAINKLRAMQKWFDMHDEHFNQQFKNLTSLEKIFDYSVENNLEFMDPGYLHSDNVTAKERLKTYKFIFMLKNSEIK